MNDTSRLRTLLSICVHMAHDIMADFLFPRFRHIIIDVFGVGLQLVNLLLGNNRPAVPAQPQLLLRLRQGYPQTPPGAEFHIL